MIDPRDPDYTNLPTSKDRLRFGYQPGPVKGDPPLSIITPCYNVESWYFDKTIESVLQQSLQNFEWILVDDGSTDNESIAILEALAEGDLRVRVIRQENAGPGAARNRGAKEARGKYLAWLDADDLIEPTYLEKATWCLESHPQFAFCNAWPVGFGKEEYLWPRGFNRGRVCLHENQADSTTLVRRSVHLQVGGFDESIRVGHEDWDYWLSMASHGFWGWTMPEFQIWYRRRDHSRVNQTDGDAGCKAAFVKFLRKKHAALYENEDRFPHPADPDDLSPARVAFDMPFSNPLANPRGRNRLLLIVPWLAMGGADKFNLDLVAQLEKRNWDITIATSMPSDHAWLPEFTRRTPDVFCLDRFLKLADYPRFLLYLLRSRGVTHVLTSNSQLGYELLPMLRSHHRQAAFMDYCHSETPQWKDGGYPAMAARWTECLDLHGVTSDHLRDWMIARGVSPDKIETCTINIDPDTWSPARFDRQAERSRWLNTSDPPDRPIVVWVGRFVEDKRPMFLIDILRRLRDDGADFLALLVGDGEYRDAAASFIHKHRLRTRVRLLGSLPNREIAPLLAAADVFLLPSKVEGVALAIFEAMSMGLACVSAEVGGQSELVTPEVGHLIPHGQAEEEMKAYLSVLHRLIEDPAYRRRLGAAARQRIVDHFNLDEMGDRMRALLLRAAENHKNHPQPTMPPATAAECAALSVDRFRLDRLADRLWIDLNRQAAGQPDDASQPAHVTLSLAWDELAYIENSRSWQTIQRIKRTWLYRGFARLVLGRNGDPVELSDPRDKLAAIKRSRFYRLLRAIKRTTLYRIYARRKYGPDFSNPWA